MYAHYHHTRHAAHVGHQHHRHYLQWKPSTDGSTEVSVPTWWTWCNPPELFRHRHQQRAHHPGNQNVSPSLEESCDHFLPDEPTALLVVLFRGLHHTLIIFVDLMHVRGLSDSDQWEDLAGHLIGFNRSAVFQTLHSFSLSENVQVSQVAAALPVRDWLTQPGEINPASHWLNRS